MSDCVVAKAVSDHFTTQKRLNELTELMNEAFVVFDYESAWGCKLPNVTSVIEKYWEKFTKYPIDFCQLDYDKLWGESHRLSKAFITREDFNKLLAPYRKAIEEYSSKLEAEVEKKRQCIIKLYDDFEQFGTSQFAFIFKQEEVKKIFIQFLMSNYALAKAVFDYYNSQKQLKELTELMNEAFVVFDYESAGSCKLSNVTSVIEKYWAKFTRYPIDFCALDYDKLLVESHRLSKAFITRKGFNRLLTPYRKLIEKYSSTLEAEVEEKRQCIINPYDNFEQFGTCQLAFIFKQEEIKEIFIQFLLF